MRTPENLPPGKAGLIVGTLRINGIVRGSGGMIAIVSNPQQRVYFLREGDKLYDGSVDHITLEAISFQRVWQRRIWKTPRTSGDQATLPKSRRTAMKTKWPAFGFGCLLLAGAAVAIRPRARR